MDYFMTTSTKPVTPPLCGSCRLTLAMVSCLGFIIMNALHFNLGMTMKYMVNSTALLDLQDLNHTLLEELRHSRTDCLDKINTYNRSFSPLLWQLDNPEMGSHVWSSDIQVMIVASFYLGYALTQIPGGWYSERYGGKRLFKWAMLFSGLVTVLTPLAAELHYSYLILMRLCLGLLQGVMWPAMNTIFCRWCPPLERGRLIGLTYAGSNLGVVITFPVAFILGKGMGFVSDWRVLYFVTGLMAILWTVLWEYAVQESPMKHLTISRHERSYICYSLRKTPVSMTVTVQSIPWKSILTSLPVWAVFLTHSCANVIMYSWIRILPFYLYDELRYQADQISYMSSIPFLLMFIVGCVSGYIYDHVASKRKFSMQVLRKTANTLGMMAPAVFSLCLTILSCPERDLATTVLYASLALTGVQCGAGFFLNVYDLAPQFSGVIFGISHTLATAAGALSLFLTSKVLVAEAEGWRTFFYLSSTILTIGAVLYLLVGSCQLQPWARTRREDQRKLTAPVESTETLHHVLMMIGEGRVEGEPAHHMDSRYSYPSSINLQTPFNTPLTSRSAT